MKFGGVTVYFVKMGWINPPRISRRPKSPQLLGLNLGQNFGPFLAPIWPLLGPYVASSDDENERQDLLAAPYARQQPARVPTIFGH